MSIYMQHQRQLKVASRNNIILEALSGIAFAGTLILLLVFWAIAIV